MANYLCEFMRDAIQARGLDASVFTRLLVDRGVPRSTVSNWLRGKVVRPNRRHVPVIAEVLEVEPDVLIRVAAGSQEEERSWASAMNRPVPRPSIRRLLRQLDAVREKLLANPTSEAYDQQLTRLLSDLDAASDRAIQATAS